MKKVLLTMIIAFTGWQSAHADALAYGARGHTKSMCNIFGKDSWACQDATATERRRVLDALGTPGWQDLPRGTYQNSCRNCVFEKSGDDYQLTCNCDDGTGGYFPYATAKGDTMLGCAQHAGIVNCAGVLKCDGCMGRPPL